MLKGGSCIDVYVQKLACEAVERKLTWLCKPYGVLIKFPLAVSKCFRTIGEVGGGL